MLCEVPDTGSVLQGPGPQGKLGPHPATLQEMQGYSVYPPDRSCRNRAKTCGTDARSTMMGSGEA